MDDTEDQSKRPRESVEEPLDASLDLEQANRVRIGVSRGEATLEIGPPRDYPDRADLSVRPDDGGRRLVVSIDATAGDHGTGHADVELTPTEVQALQDRLERVGQVLANGDEQHRE
ncbi:hypothetical protein [Halopiger djelfimassiliensis]|uniref:hypothetical protein n=1 Tax=Halopiger djelfimassiliensis TaxID=1293047 RepID=UPI0006778CC0|nr:hypothetical protein [Halopiger djelfimassiliensis]